MKAAEMYRQCFKKSRYKTYDKAEKAKWKCEELRPDQELRIYSCPVCSFFHLTAQKKRD